MKEIILWTNTNQGFVSALLTFVYVVTTLGILYATWRQSKLTKTALDLTLAVEKARSRPFVYFDIQLRGLSVCAVLKNSGSTPALNLFVETNPKIQIEGLGATKTPQVTSHEIACLLPEREIVELIDGNRRFHDLYPDPHFKVSLRYSDMTGEAFAYDYAVSPRFEYDIPRLESESVAQIRRVADALEKR